MKHKLATIIPTFFISVLATLIVANLGDQQKDIDYQIHNLSAVTHPQWSLAIENLMGPAIVHGNQITAYQNGDEIFPPMLEAIRGAKKTINFETYIYLSGKVADQFVEALTERARAGVKVHMLIDWVGSQKIEEALIDKLKAGGVQVEWYHKIAWYTISRFNNRTHRKILVVDGKIGFTGGVGIADDWLGDARNEKEWRDTHFKVTGPVVGQLQAAFADNWITVAPEVQHDETYFPKIEPSGASEAQMFKSSPREGAASAQLLYILSIAAAKKSIHIATAYFVPGDLAIKALVDAQKRGVNVEIIVPGEHIDSQLVHYASRHRFEELLRAGIKIYEYQPTMFHCKIMVIDEAWSSVGSTNFDDRSFRLNSEANLNILDEKFAKEQIAVFEQDKSKAKLITLDDWENRSFGEKILGWCANLFKTQI